MHKISLKAARVNANLTQEEVAKIIGVTRQTIINWEKGVVIPKIPNLVALSNLYNISIDFIFLPCYSTFSRENVLKKEKYK